MLFNWFATNWRKDEHFYSPSKLAHQSTLNKLLLKIEEKIVNYTAFNDAMESFLTNVSCKTALSDISTTELAKLFVDAGSQKMAVDKSAGVIAQFLPTT